MANRLAAFVALCTALFMLVGTALAADTKKDKGDLNDLSLELAAHQLIYQFEFTPSQLQALANWAKTTASTSERRPAKGSDKLRGLMVELRAAYRKRDEARIDELTEKVDELKEKEKPDIDDNVEPTDAARKAAVEAARLLTTRQTLDYLNLYEELPDPAASVREALKSGLKLKDRDWSSIRDDAAAEVAWQIAGFDKDRADKVRAQTAALLDKAHAWKEKELAEQQPELEKALQEIMGDSRSTDVLRHIIERDLAELLANPQLAAAIEGKMPR
jgi:hypothetical protein